MTTTGVIVVLLDKQSLFQFVYKFLFYYFVSQNFVSVPYVHAIKFSPYTYFIKNLKDCIRRNKLEQTNF